MPPSLPRRVPGAAMRPSKGTKAVSGGHGSSGADRRNSEAPGWPAGLGCGGSVDPPEGNVNRGHHGVALRPCACRRQTERGRRRDLLGGMGGSAATAAECFGRDRSRWGGQPQTWWVWAKPRALTLRRMPHRRARWRWSTRSVVHGRRAARGGQPMHRLAGCPPRPMRWADRLSTA